jgi:hypothetical protein
MENFFEAVALDCISFFLSACCSAYGLRLKWQQTNSVNDKQKANKNRHKVYSAFVRRCRK